MGNSCCTYPKRTIEQWIIQPDVQQFLNRWLIFTTLFASIPLIILTIIIYWYGYQHYQLPAVIWLYGWSSHRLLLPLMNLCKPVRRVINPPAPMYLYQIPWDEMTLMDLLHGGRFQNPPAVDNWEGRQEFRKLGVSFFLFVNCLWTVWGSAMAMWAWYRAMGYIFGEYKLAGNEWMWILLFFTFLIDAPIVGSFIDFVEKMNKQPFPVQPREREIVFRPIEAREEKKVEIPIIENPNIAKHTYYTTCVICMDSFKEGDDVKELNCKHIFHPKCIDAWTMNMKRNDCPTCKAKI